LGKAGRGAGLTLIGARTVGCGGGNRVLGGLDEGVPGFGAGACRGAGATLVSFGDDGPGVGTVGGSTARVITGDGDGRGAGEFGGGFTASTGLGHSNMHPTPAPATMAAAKSSSDHRRLGDCDSDPTGASVVVVVVSPAIGSNRYSNRSERSCPAIPRSYKRV